MDLVRITEKERNLVLVLSYELFLLAGFLHSVQVEVILRHESLEKEKDGGSDDEAYGEGTRENHGAPPLGPDEPGERGDFGREKDSERPDDGGDGKQEKKEQGELKPHERPAALSQEQNGEDDCNAGKTGKQRKKMKRAFQFELPFSANSADSA